MKKRIFALLLTLAMTISMTACGSSGTSETTQDTRKESTQDTRIETTVPATSTRPASPYDDSTLESIITGIETDFADSIKFLQTEFDKTNNTIGETYEGYIKNKQALTYWYNLVLEEQAALFGRTKERTIKYFKLISSSIDHEDGDAIYAAMDDYYNRICDGVMSDFYDDVYLDLMGDAYDTYYCGILEDGYDVDPYEKWSDELSEACKVWSDTNNSVYKGWYYTNTVLCQYWTAVNSGFYKDNFDIDAIIEEYKKEKAEAEA